MEFTDFNTIHIDPATRFVGKALVYLPEVSSTMDYAADLLAKKNPAPREGTVVWADLQTRGRGQGNNTWLSLAGQNLTISVILYPGFLRVDRQFLLNEIVALAVSDTVTALTEQQTFIKWPNDIICQGKKVAGILIQNTLGADKLRSSIVGIGLNVNQKVFPPLPMPAGSLALLTSHTFDRAMVCESLCENLERWYLMLRNGLSIEIESAYLQKLLHLGQRRIYARSDGSRFSGRITGITRHGQLVVETDDGVQHFDTRQVRWLSLEDGEVT